MTYISEGGRGRWERRKHMSAKYGWPAISKRTADWNATIFFTGEEHDGKIQMDLEGKNCNDVVNQMCVGRRDLSRDKRNTI